MLLLAIAFLIIVVGVTLLTANRPSNETEAEQDNIEEQTGTDSTPKAERDEQILTETKATEEVSVSSASEETNSETIDKADKGSILDKIKATGLPKNPILTGSEEDASNSNDEASEDVEDVPEIITIDIPDDLSIGNFMKRHKMNMSDFKNLNPGIDPDSIKPGMTIKVYKR